MCGIAGVVAWDDRYRVDRETLRRMSARIAHRGPDGDGLYLNHEQEARPDRPQVGLVHRRLAIIDLDPRSNQPFTDRHGRWIVFNGEIYNYRELRAELTSLQPDYEWRTTSDTEVLLVAYDAWGEKCVKKLNGMFAFAVWDEPKQALFLARDRMGQKPLYVSVLRSTGSPGTIHDGSQHEKSLAAVAFSSEIPPLLELSWVDRSISPGNMGFYLTTGYSSGGTIYRGVQQVHGSSTLLIRYAAEESIKYKQYFHSGRALPDGLLDDGNAVRSTRRLLRAAVSKQLVSDVPIGCFLSGGVDSSVIAAAMRREAPVESFSIGFADARYDERKYAREVAKHLGTRHHEFEAKPDAPHDLLKVAAAFGEPFADSSALPTHYLSQLTRKQVKVALSGDGGDELFCGYDRYRAMKVGDRLRRIPASLLKSLPAIGSLLPGTHPKSTLTRLKRFCKGLADLPRRQYLRYVRLFDEAEVIELVRAELRGPVLETVQEAEQVCGDYFESGGVVRAAIEFDKISYLPGDLLTKVDRCSMLHALEVRSPFMDHELVQFAAGLTTDQLLKGGPKRMLREAFADDLPAWVFKRKKMGFAVPIGDWFRAELRPMLHDHLFAQDSFAAGHFNTPVVRRLVEEHETRRQDHSQRLYALLMLELWWKQQKP